MNRKLWRLAVLAVGLVILFTMGWRSALVVMMAVPVTFALTLFVYQVFGYTPNWDPGGFGSDRNWPAYVKKMRR